MPGMPQRDGRAAPRRTVGPAAPEFDQLAELYDETRGGEERGDDYAAEVTAWLPPPDGPILEVGVGTGVVALGLAARGHRVIGVDISSPMLARARRRLGPVVVLGDAMALPLASGSIAHAVSVWVVQAVAEPVRLFTEVARVLRPSGRYVICTTQRPAADDVIGQIIKRMTDEVDAWRLGRGQGTRGVTADQVLDWGAAAGWEGDLHHFELVFDARPSQELDAVERRAWPALREMDTDQAATVTRPAIEALRLLPDVDHARRMTGELLVLHRSGEG
jgi:ubiquinone/menaquinone biosynthesis C-methylase UbiE